MPMDPILIHNVQDVTSCFRKSISMLSCHSYPHFQQCLFFSCISHSAHTQPISSSFTHLL